MPLLLTPANLLPLGLTINRPACEDSSLQTHTLTHFPFLYLALFGQTDGYEKEGVSVINPWFFNSQHLISKEQGGQMCIYITQATE